MALRPVPYKFSCQKRRRDASVRLGSKPSTAAIVKPIGPSCKRTFHRGHKALNSPGTSISQGSYSAFVPAPLPPELDWTPRLIGVLSDADRLVGRLAGEGGRLPNPHILIRPFVRREAVLSSKIEGTQATLGELLAAEAGATVDRSPDDLREVGNYVVALEHGISRLKKLPLCVRLARELHEKLMTGVRGHRAAPGQFRKIQNWIGKPGSTIATASYMPPPPGEIEPCLAAWEGFMHESAPPQYSPITKPDFDQVSELSKTSVLRNPAPQLFDRTVPPGKRPADLTATPRASRATSPLFPMV